MKKIFAIIFGVSAVLLVICALLPLIPLQTALAQNDSVGIIGGADGPTVMLVSRTLGGGALSLLMTFAAATVLSALFCLIFSKHIKENCTLKTSGIALCLSAVFALLVYCIFSFAVCFIMTSPDKHPVALPVSIIVGLVSFAAFAVLSCIYGKLRAKKYSVKGIVTDILLFLVYLLPFFSVYNFFCDLIV